MKILILGGTKFAGLHAALEAVSKNHEVTLFNRGTHPAPDGVTSIVGDRLTPDGYTSLDGLTFDVVIDTWSTDPVAIQLAIEALRGRVGHYIYISSLSVYDFEKGKAPYDESTPFVDPEKTDVQYFKDKVRGEAFVSESGIPATFIRPGVILGPDEGVWRLPWWLLRMKRGGKTLAPGPKELQLQFIDVRDLAAFTIKAAEEKLEGAYNLVSEIKHISMGKFLDTANKAAGNHADLCWLEPKEVLEAGVRPWVELPMWLPPGELSVYSTDVSKALKAGLKIRTAEQTISDTWDWVASLKSLPSSSKVGLDAAKEKAVLDKYCAS